jgi:hypothetical protein
VIGVRLGRENYSSVPHNYDRKGLEPLDDRAGPQIRLNGPIDWIVVVKTKK